MKFRELLKESSKNILTGLEKYDWSESENSIKKLGTESFGEELGVFGINKDNKERFIYRSKNDELFMKQAGHKLNSGEFFVRMITYNSSVSGQAFLIKINPNKGLVYFIKNLEEDDIAEIEFDKPVKVDYIRTSLK